MKAKFIKNRIVLAYLPDFISASSSFPCFPPLQPHKCTRNNSTSELLHVLFELVPSPPALSFSSVFSVTFSLITVFHSRIFYFLFLSVVFLLSQRIYSENVGTFYPSLEFELLVPPQILKPFLQVSVCIYQGRGCSFCLFFPPAATPSHHWMGVLITHLSSSSPAHLVLGTQQHHSPLHLLHRP